jgi:hypothetical protein
MARRKKSKNKEADKEEKCDDDNSEVETESQDPDNNSNNNNTGDDEDVMEMVMSEKVNAMERGKSRDFDQMFSVPTTERRDTNTMDRQESIPELMIDTDTNHNNQSAGRTSLLRNTTNIKTVPGAFRVRTVNITNNRDSSTTDGHNDQDDGFVIIPEASLVRTASRQAEQHEDLENPSSSLSMLNQKEAQVTPMMIAEVVVSEAKAANIDDENEENQKQQLKIRRRRRIFGCVILCLLLLIAAVLIALLVQVKNESSIIIIEDDVDDMDEDLHNGVDPEKLDKDSVKAVQQKYWPNRD